MSPATSLGALSQAASSQAYTTPSADGGELSSMNTGKALAKGDVTNTGEVRTKPKQSKSRNGEKNPSKFYLVLGGMHSGMGLGVVTQEDRELRFNMDVC